MADDVFIGDEEPSAGRRRMPAGVVAPALVGALLLAANVCGVRGVDLALLGLSALRCDSGSRGDESGSRRAPQQWFDASH
jgi:hypothetical protein